MDFADKTTFALPDYQPAIGDQQSAQTSTYALRKAMMPTPAGSDLDYDAYKLGQQALGKKPLGKQSWQMMYRHELMMNNILPAKGI